MFHLGQFLWGRAVWCGNSRELIRQESRCLDWVSRFLRSDTASVFEKKGGAPKNELEVWGP